MAYLPPAEYEAAWDRQLLDATMYRRHEDYRRELAQALHTIARPQGALTYVVPLDVEGLVAFAQREGRDPASRQTRLDYNDSLGYAGRDVPWPPERNAPCWCGSTRKYKKCCGDPGFLAVELPDPASLVLRVELDEVQPPVWRRVAVPSNTPLDQVHQMLQAAMGWEGKHGYEFQTGGIILTPGAEAPGIAAEGERLVAIATEPGESFSYLYAYGWRHTVTLEEALAADGENTFRTLGGAGACPPEDCDGPEEYLELLQALTDPADPGHLDAVELFGEDYDPAQYEPRAGSNADIEEQPGVGTTQIYQLKIQLKGSKPPIWRRIQVPGRVSLAELHPIILAAMGWYGGHMYAFWVGNAQYGDPDPELNMGDARRLTLAAAARTGAPLSYDYDFGDDWEHRITVEKILPAEPGVTYPRCLTGKRACPPEDCGGIYGFYELLEAVADPDHPQHDEALEQLPPDYDPARFDLEWTNLRLSAPADHVVLRDML
jgi:hypothetical protein